MSRTKLMTSLLVLGLVLMAGLTACKPKEQPTEPVNGTTEMQVPTTTEPTEPANQVAPTEPTAPVDQATTETPAPPTEGEVPPAGGEVPPAPVKGM